MADLFWDIATSHVALTVIGIALVAALVVGYFPLLKWFPVIGTYVPVARLAAFILLALICFLIGFRISDERAEADALRSKLAAASVDLEATQQAANEAEAARVELAKQSQADQERIAQYETTLKARPADGCALTDDDLRWLRVGPPSR